MQETEYIIGWLTDEFVDDLVRRGCRSIKFMFWTATGKPVHMGVMKCYTPVKSLALAA